MAREWAVISALGPTPVRVPAALGFCGDTAVTGAQFYVMGFVDGHPLHNADDTRRWVAQPKREGLAHTFIDGLADLHALDPDAIGLGDLGKRDSYIARQVKAWYRSWTASVAPAGYDDPRAHELRAYFLAHLPDPGEARVVHGDYGLHNCLIGPDGRVAAVVDWEISTLGDPLADLAYVLNQWPDPGEAPPPRREPATFAPGFPARAQLARRYAARTGRDLAHLDYYVAFNRWKTAAINHGVYARYREGKKTTEGVDLDMLKASVDASLTLSEQALARLES
jgi:aminoglycoside phosphotransferase (APT) family kinase protein